MGVKSFREYKLINWMFVDYKLTLLYLLYLHSLRFPQLFDFISRQERGGPDFYFEEDVFPSGR